MLGVRKMPATKKKYKDEDWLRRQYWGKGKTVVDIAADCSVATSTLYKWFDRLGIERRSASKAQSKYQSEENTGKKYTDQKWLREQYCGQGKTSEEIAEKCGVSFATILRWMDTFGIERRDVSGSNHPRYKGGKVELTCEWCGGKYKVDPYREEGSKYCSKECATKALHDKVSGESNWNWKGGKVEKTCKQCGETYKVERYKSDKSKFCSQECKSDWQEEHFMGEGNPHYQGGKISKKCRWCGSKFYGYPAELDSKHFCSDECRSEWWSKNLSGENHHAYKERVELECEYCGEKYEVLPSHTENSRFCSRECLGKWKSKNVVGPQHPQWEGGHDEYMKKLGENKGSWEFNKKKALERDRHTCQLCGAEENGRKHDVHHIKPVRQGGSNYIGNLITLCQICHREIEAENE